MENVKQLLDALEGLPDPVREKFFEVPLAQVVDFVTAHRADFETAQTAITWDRLRRMTPAEVSARKAEVDAFLASQAGGADHEK